MFDLQRNIGLPLSLVIFSCAVLPAYVMAQNCQPRPGLPANWCQHNVQKPQVPIAPRMPFAPTNPVVPTYPFPQLAPNPTYPSITQTPQQPYTPAYPNTSPSAPNPWTNPTSPNYSQVYPNNMPFNQGYPDYTYPTVDNYTNVCLASDGFGNNGQCSFYSSSPVSSGTPCYCGSYQGVTQ